MKKLIFGVVVVSAAFMMGRVSAQSVEPSCDGCQVTRISAAEIQEYVEIGRSQNRIDQQVRSVDVATMETRLSASVASPRFYALFVGAFAALALVLAAVGIYGILSYIVSQLRVEIGVRVALGAGRQDILTMVLPQGAWLTGLGLIIGLAGAFATTRLEIALFAAIHGSAWGVRGTLINAIRADYFGRASYATISGFASLIIMVGMTTGPLFAGYLHDLTGGYQQAFMVLAGLSALGSIALFLARKPKTPTS